MGPAVSLWNVVREAENVLLVRVVPLKGRLDAISVAIDGEIAHRWIETGLVAVQVLDEGPYSAIVVVDVALARSLVRERDSDSRVEKGELTKPAGKEVVMKLDVGERIRTRREPQLGTGTVGFPGHTKIFHGLAVPIFLYVLPSVAPDPEPEGRRQCVDDGDPDSMQAARHLVSVLVEFSARVKHGHDDLGRRPPFFFVNINGYAAAVVGNRHRLTVMNGDSDFGAVTGQRFVDRIVDCLKDQMVQPGAIIGIPDEHAGALSDRF